MNRITQTALLLVAIMSASSLGFAQTGKPSEAPPPTSAAEHGPRAWKEFSSEKGRFSVLLPGTPAERAELFETSAGKLSAVLFILSSSATYAVTYADFPVSIEDPGRVKQALDAGRDGAVRNVEGTLLEDREISLGVHPGRHVKARTADGKTIRSRFYAVGKRLYTLIHLAGEDGAGATALRSNEETAAKFLDSFKLMESAEVSPRAVGEPEGSPAEPKAEGEVNRLLKSLHEKGELVIGVCEDGADCQALPDIEGVTVEDRGQVVTIKVINKPPPVYPPIARAARAQGTVTVQVLVDEEGRVIAAQAVGGHPLLQAAAVKAAREVIFSPVLLGTKPVKVSGVIKYNFVLQ